MIAHCPISNALPTLLPLPDALARRPAGLATDIGAGVRVGVFQQIHDAVILPIRQDGVDARKDPDARRTGCGDRHGYRLLAGDGGCAEAAACPSVCWSRDAGSMRSFTSTPRVG